MDHSFCGLTPAAKRYRRFAAAEACPEKKKICPESEVEQNLESLLETRTAGDPDDEERDCLHRPVSCYVIRKTFQYGNSCK